MDTDFQLSDLVVAFTLGESVLICIRKEDIDKEDAKSVKLDLISGEFFIDNLQRFLKFGFFEYVTEEDETLQQYYRNLIYRNMSDDIIVDVLDKFGGLWV